MDVALSSYSEHHARHLFKAAISRSITLLPTYLKNKEDIYSATVCSIRITYDVEDCMFTTFHSEFYV